jgi:hypothetical protein
MEGNRHNGRGSLRHELLHGDPLGGVAKTSSFGNPQFDDDMNGKIDEIGWDLGSIR